jgi:hypothetical protein
MKHRIIFPPDEGREPVHTTCPCFERAEKMGFWVDGNGQEFREYRIQSITPVFVLWPDQDMAELNYIRVELKAI